MNKTWLIIEKIIGVLLGAWGIVALYSITLTIANMLRQGYVAANHISLFQIFLGGHVNFLLAVAAIVGGFLLLFNDRQGWFLSVVSSALYVLTFFRSAQANAAETQPYYPFAKSYSLMSLMFLVVLILLIQKPFIKKYSVTLKHWLWVMAVVTLIILDKLFLK
jgi:hypothetical protein